MAGTKVMENGQLDDWPNENGMTASHRNDIFGQRVQRCTEFRKNGLLFGCVCAECVIYWRCRCECMHLLSNATSPRSITKRKMHAAATHATCDMPKIKNETKEKRNINKSSRTHLEFELSNGEPKSPIYNGPRVRTRARARDGIIVHQ